MGLGGRVPKLQQWIWAGACPPYRKSPLQLNRNELLVGVRMNTPPNSDGYCLIRGMTDYGFH